MSELLVGGEGPRMVLNIHQFKLKSMPSCTFRVCLEVVSEMKGKGLGEGKGKGRIDSHLVW